MKTKRSFFKTILLTLLATASFLTATATDTDTIRFTWEATSEGTKTFYLRVPDGKQYTVDWGNDSLETRIGVEIGTYQSLVSPVYMAGIYAVTIIGNMTTGLIFSSNPQLISLNFDNCTALKHINCDNYDLTSLNINNCTALSWINCSKNKLTSLDVSSCALLEHLFCYDNELTDLNISNCTILTELSCDNNRLCSLNVGNNTSFMGLSLSCRNNQLSSIILNNDNFFLSGFFCNNNSLLLSDIYAVFQKISSINGGFRGVGMQRLIPRTISVGDTIDYSSQAEFGGIATVFLLKKMM